jgi:hypothetical protein
MNWHAFRDITLPLEVKGTIFDGSGMQRKSTTIFQAATCLQQRIKEAKFPIGTSFPYWRPGLSEASAVSA